MTSPLYGQMIEVPLFASSLLSHASRHFCETEIVSRRIGTLAWNGYRLWIVTTAFRAWVRSVI